MGGGHAGVVPDLLAAAKARYHRQGIASVTNGRKQPLLSDGPGHLVVLYFVPERAGHPAASTVDFDGLARGAGPPTPLKPGDTVRLGQVEFTFTDAAALREFALQAGG